MLNARNTALSISYEDYSIALFSSISYQDYNIALFSTNSNNGG